MHTCESTRAFRKEGLSLFLKYLYLQYLLCVYTASMKRILIIIVSTVAVIYGAGIISMIILKSVDNNSAYTSDYTTQEPVDQQEQFRDEFMEGCSGEGATDQYCSCTYDGLIGLYGFDGLTDNIGRLARVEFSEADLSVIRNCTHLL